MFAKYNIRDELSPDYHKRARALIFNFSDDKNPHLRLDTISDKFTSEFLVTCDPKDLASKEIKQLREKMLKEGLDAARTDFQSEQLKKKALESGAEGFFTCKKCKSKKTTYFQMQTRGADEPMTNFVNCLDCKYQWKC